MNRMTLIKIHLLLAAFMFPVALMFLVTGSLYTWGFKGSYEPGVYELQLDAPLQADAAALAGLVERELAQRSLTVPSGGYKIKNAGTSFQFEWTGAARDVLLEPTAEPTVAQLTVKETSWYRNLVQLHKAKGGVFFKIYAAALAIALFAILASGFLMAWQVPKLRGLANGCAAAGLLVFALVVALS